MERLTEKHYLGTDHYMKCSGSCNVDMGCIDIQPKNLRYAEGTDRISHLEKMQIMQQKRVRKHSLYL